MQDPGTNAPLPSKQTQTANFQGCEGINLLLFTGSNSNFSSCGPYSANSTLASSTMARLVLGGSPAPLDNNGNLVPIPGTIQIPNLLALCASDSQLGQCLAQSKSCESLTI
jgi:hypothetical protein